MTVVVGLVHDGTVWMGGDSAANSDHAVMAYANPKVFRRGALLFGIVESFRMRDILQHDLVIPRRPTGLTDEAYLVSHVVEEIRCTFDAVGFPFTEVGGDEDEALVPGAVLLGYRGRLYVMDWDYHLGSIKSGYHAIGSGADFALGSLHTTQSAVDRTPRQRVRQALEAAAQHSSEVGPPFRILSLRAPAAGV